MIVGIDLGAGDRTGFAWVDITGKVFGSAEYAPFGSTEFWRNEWARGGSPFADVAEPIIGTSKIFFTPGYRITSEEPPVAVAAEGYREALRRWRQLPTDQNTARLERALRKLRRRIRRAIIEGEE